jgi:DNA-binding transcriptional LysR family regulator
VSGKPSDGPSFELRHLRYFVAVAEERNFGRAAERLGIAQPGLSQQIASLEALVGTRLLDRSKRLFRLALPGQVFLAEARKTLAQADTAFAAVQRAARGETGRVSIGYVASAAYSGVLTEVISAFRDTHPEVELVLIEMEMLRQLDHIVEGALDFGFIRPPAPVPRGLEALTVQSEPLVALLPSGHRLAQAEPIALRDLAAETFIVPNQTADVGFHRQTAQACKDAGINPTIQANGRDFMTIASMVTVGLGVALVPRSMECMQLPGIVYRPLASPVTRSEISAVFRRNEAAPAANAFITHCRAEVRRRERSD